MKSTALLFIICSFLLTSCTPNNKKAEAQNDNRTLVPDPEGLKKDSFMMTENKTGCNFERLLNDPATPLLAKQLFAGTAKYSEEPLSFFDSLKNKDPEKTAFYFKAITNSYRTADGAYAEGLGNLGKEFIENHPQTFAAFFDNSNCFADNDLHTWAKIVLLEFEIIDDNIESNKGEQPLIHKFRQELIRNSKPYTDNQKNIIKKFASYLNEEWADNRKINRKR